MAEIKLRLVFVTTAGEAIMSLPGVAVLHRRIYRILSGGPQEPSGGQWIGLRPPALDSNVRATKSPNALPGRNDRKPREIFSRCVVSLLEVPSDKLNEYLEAGLARQQQEFEWKSECRKINVGARFVGQLAQRTPGSPAREGMNMKNMATLALLVVAFAGVGCAQEPP
jgi:hypothetical protein